MESSLAAPFRGPRARGAGRARTSRSAAQAPLVALEPLEAETARRRGRARPLRVAAAAGAVGGARALPREPATAAVARARLRRRAPARSSAIIADLHGECADMLACDPALVARRAPPARRCSPTCALLSRRDRDETDPDAPLLAQPAGVPARLPALARRRSRGAARRASSTQLRRALAHYGVDEPRAHARARGRLLPDVPLRAARRGGAHGDRRDPRPPPRAGRASSRGHVGDDFREAPRPPGASRSRAATPCVADLAREVRFRYFDEPLIATRPRARLRRDGGAPRRARRRPGARRTATSASPRSSHCPQPLGAAADRAHARRRAARCARLLRRGADAPLLPHPLARRASSSSSSSGHAFARRPLPVRGQQPHARGGLRRARRRRRGRARRSPRHAATLPDGERAVARPLRRSTRGRAVAPASWPRRCGRRSPTCPLSPALHRIVVAVAEPRRGRGMSAIDLVHVPARRPAASPRTSSSAACTR